MLRHNQQSTCLALVKAVTQGIELVFLPAERPQASMYRARDRRLWGEVETEGPPRWNHARRRSSLAPAPTMLPEAMPDMSARNGWADPIRAVLASTCSGLDHTD